MKIDLSNQKILVTGASRGIGKSIAQLLAGSGAQVAVHYNRNKADAEALAREIGGGAQSFQANLESAEDCVRLVSEVLESFGQIDVLVNNAGIVVPIERDADTDSFQSGWNKTLQVNLVATALLCHELIPHFSKQGGGRFIHISSRAAFRGDTPEYMAYAASKGGMVALSRSIARAFGKEGIKSFIVAPGFTRTDMAQEFIDTYGEEIVLNDLALNQLTEPKDVAPSVLFLASGMMDHATGCSIDINAGSYVH
ncbi:MAG: SDR family oxidoreductase [Bacteroidia bacterium]|nr:SDR family oxidoreductase [Bacteroidia bacterium]